MLTPRIDNLLSRDLRAPERLKAANSEPTISVHRITNKAAVLYEKLRYLVDYKDENTIRRSAIERILRRAIVIENRADVGTLLLRELVSAGYLPNETVPEREAAVLSTFVDAYRSAFPTLSQKITMTETEKVLLSLMASEVEAYLYPSLVNDAVADAFFQTIKERVRCVGAISADELDMQLYIASRRALLREDDEAVAYALWCRTLGTVPGSLDTSKAVEMSQDVPGTIARIRLSLRHRIGPMIMGKIKNDAICFTVIAELIRLSPANPKAFFDDQKVLHDQAEAFLSSKYKIENSRVMQSSLRAVAYIFCTKILVALALEVPYDLYISGVFDYVPLAINIIFHPFLLFLITRNIKLLGPENTKSVVSRIDAIVYGGEAKSIPLKYKASAGGLNLFFGLLYGMMFLVSFGVIVWALASLGFNPVGILLFLLFLALVSYFGLRIRYNAQRWRFAVAEDRVLFLIWSFLTLPVIRAGRWLTEKFSTVNIFVFVLDVIIEAPFKLALKLSDLFILFLKDKKEETY
ncbi:MAG: hypothetical protein WC763_03365 [Candidatus Paceibacterota bacterium]|jgi:hypothetical protein